MKNDNFTANQLANNPSFIRWVEGSAESSSEVRFWDQWIKENEQNRKVAIKAQQNVSGFSFDDRNLPNVDREWESVRERLESSCEKKISTNKSHYSFLNSDSRAFKRFLKIAAIIVVVFAASWILIPRPSSFSGKQEVKIQTIATDYKEKKTIRLTDGSKIILAAGSQLSYAQNWLQKPVKRLKLKGEAYFSIVPEKVKNHPKFIVETEDGSASVWGTIFSVSTYNKETQVVLKRGKVKVKVNGVFPKDESVTMTPGQLASFHNANAAIAIRKVNPSVYMSWASDKLVFDDTPLSMLVERIKRTYGVNVKIKDKELSEKRLSGSVDFKDLDSLIRAVSEVLKVNISRRNDTVFINNTNQTSITNQKS